MNPNTTIPPPFKKLYTAILEQTEPEHNLTEAFQLQNTLGFNLTFVWQSTGKWKATDPTNLSIKKITIDANVNSAETDQMVVNIFQDPDNGEITLTLLRNNAPRELSDTTGYLILNIKIYT